eukprot:scaffold1390_cov138-Cylindrotheca_fusiformis.AAC.12
MSTFRLLCLASLTGFGVNCFSSQRFKRNIHISTTNFPPDASSRSIAFRTKDRLTSICRGQSSDDVEQDANFVGSNNISAVDTTPVEPSDLLVNASSTDIEPQATLGVWPCLDKMDRDLIKISLPVIGNFAINPLIGAVDLFWVNRMGNALAVAGQAAANQVFSSAFWFTSFLPSVTATLVSKQHAKGDKEGTQDAICQALFVGFFIAMIGTPLMFFNPDKALSSVLRKGAPALEYARPFSG